MMKYIKDQDWDTLGKQFRSAEPFPSICIDNFLDSEFALEVSKSYPDFSNAQKQGREFRTVNEKCKVEIIDPLKFPEPIARLRKALASEEFLSSMQRLSGIEDLRFDPNFSGGGMHMTNHSGILDVHVDFNYSKEIDLYRRLNILIYFNQTWKENWGGEVELWDKNVSNCINRFSPVLNRCVIFATSDFSFHGVTAVDAPLGNPRKSFAIYLYNSESSSTTFGEHHSTVFRARPDEKFKKYYSMPIESAKRKVSKTIRSGKSLAKGILGRE